MTQTALPETPAYFRAMSIDAVFPITVDAYETLIQHGAITDADRVELIYGRIVRKMGLNQAHVTVSGLLMEWLNAARPDGWFVVVEAPVVIPTSMPEPDVMLVRGNRIDYLKRRYTADVVGLVIEVSDSTLDYDRDVKAGLYASAGFPVYWIANVNAHQIEMYSEPTPKGTYAVKRVYKANEHIPLILDGAIVGTTQVNSLVP